MYLLWCLDTHLWGTAQPLGYGFAFFFCLLVYLFIYFLITSVAVRTVLDLVAITVTDLSSVFCIYIFQHKVGDERVKVCTILRYGKKKVSSTYCQIGFLQMWASSFSVESVPGQPILPGSAEQQENSLKLSAIMR